MPIQLPEKNTKTSKPHLQQTILKALLIIQIVKRHSSGKYLVGKGNLDYTTLPEHVRTATIGIQENL